MSIWHAVFWFGVLVAFAVLTNAWLRLRRAEFIRTYKWPPGLLQKLIEHHPHLARKDAALVSRGLRQFFIAYLPAVLHRISDERAPFRIDAVTRR